MRGSGEDSARCGNSLGVGELDMKRFSETAKRRNDGARKLFTRGGGTTLSEMRPLGCTAAMPALPLYTSFSGSGVAAPRPGHYNFTVSPTPSPHYITFLPPLVRV